MEDTQAVNWEAEEEEETERPSDSLRSSLEPLGRLHIFSSAHGPEKDFPLYLGKNVVGRMPDCSVALPFPSISKQHAVIEILAWDKAPVLWDCGSLNGTQILRPPKFLSPGVSHRLRDQELVVFADLPCQYHRLDVSLPFFSRGPLTVEETPRVQRGTQPWGILLAEDSEEEVDPLSERCVVNEPRTMSSLLATVVPESDEEGPSVPDGPGPPYAINFDSDTDEEERQQPATGWASSAATRDATAETEQPKAVRTEIQVEKDQSLGQESNSNIRVKRDASNGVILERGQPIGEDSETDVDDEIMPPGKPAEGHLERSQPSGFIDSDTDVEEEGIPTTPAVVPLKRRQIFHGVKAESSGGPDLAHLHESPAGNETDVEEAEAPLTVPRERSQASMVSHSNVDDEEGVSAALTLASLVESRATGWNRDKNVEEDRAQPLAFLEQSQTSAGRDSGTDIEVEGFPVEKREYVPKSHTDKVQTEKSQSSFGDSDREVEEDKSSPGVLGRSQASATVGINTQVEEEVSPGPAVTLPEKHEVPLACTNPTNVEAEGGPAKLPAVRLEEAPPPPGTAGEPTQAQRKEAPTPRESGGEPHVDMTKNSGHSHDDSEDLDQQATQCFVERESQSLEAVPSMEDEPTQAFLCTPPQEPSPSHCSFQASGALDEPWEVLATQPFCLRESEASEIQPITSHLETHGSCPFSPRPTPQDQHLESPVRAEPLGIRGGGMQTAEKGLLNCKMSPAEKASRGDPGSLDVCLPPAVPEASAPVQNPLIPQSQKHLASQPLFAPSPPSLESPIPSSRQNGSQEALENPLSSKLDPLHAKPKCRSQGCSRMTSSPASSIAPGVYPLTSREQPVTPAPKSRATRGRTHRASVKTLEPTVPTAPDLEPPAPAEQPVTPVPTPRATRSRTHRASVKTPEPTVPTVPELKPPAPTDQPVTPKAIAQGGQSRTLRSTRSTVPVPTAPEFQSPFPTDKPSPPEAIPQANCSRRPRVARQPLAAPIVCEPCSAPLEPNAWSSRSQRRGAMRATKSLKTIPEPALAQLPGAPTHALQVQKVEATGGYEFSPESQRKAFQNHKRPSDTVDSPPLPKRLRREVPQKTVFLKEEEEEKPGQEEDPSHSQDVVMPGPGKRKKDQAEEEPKGMPVRSLRRTKPDHESAAPKVLFTGVVDARGEQAVLTLGGSLASSVAEASHLVTDRICRTVKFLCALGRGIPILSLDWLYQSLKAGCFLSPDEYMVTDPEQERNFGFSLRDSLSRARVQRLLEGYEIHVTPGVQPPPPQMGEIIRCCGGTVLPSMPRSYKPRRVVITCSQDAPRCTIPFQVGLPVVSPEFLLTGVLKQEANPDAFVLST